jgi:chromosome segregation ATPase
MANIMNEITDVLSSDINVITAEINSYKQIAGNAIFEIGRRLKHVRESIFREHGHYSGKWAEWLREVDFDVTTAKRFIKVFDEFGNSSDTWHHLSMRVLYEIATLPPEAREQAHTIPSTGEVKTVDEMTVRELREVKKALKEAQERAQKAEEAVQQAKSTERVLRQSIEELRNREPEIEYVEVIDEESQRKLSEYEQRFGSLDVYDNSIMRIQGETEVVGAALSFAEDVRTFVKKYAFIETYTREFTDINGAAKREYISAINIMNDLMYRLKRNIEENDYADFTIIEATN